MGEGEWGGGWGRVSGGGEWGGGWERVNEKQECGKVKKNERDGKLVGECLRSE